MFLQAQGIDDDAGVVDRVRRVRKLSDDNIGIGRGLVIDDVSERLETTTEASINWGQQQRLRRLDDGPEKLATMAEALIEEDEPDVSTTTTKASDEEAEETTCPSERL